MARVVLLTYGITSYLNAAYRLAQQLTERGHCVTFVSSLDVADRVRAQGFAFVLLEEEHAIRQDPERLAVEGASALQRYRNRAALIRVGERQRRFYLESGEIERAVRSLEPDVLLIDEELFEHIIALDKLEIPTFLLQYWPSTRKAPGVPLLDSNLTPDGSLLSKMRVELNWQTEYVKRHLKRALAPWYYRNTDRRSIVKAIAQRDGFAYDDRADHRQAMIVVFPDIPTLHLAAWEFDFPHAVPDKEHYVGPMICLDRRDGQVDPAFTDTLAAIVRRRKEQPHRRRPLIYCSIGTFWHADPDFLQRILRAFDARPEWDLILTIGSSITRDRLEPIPPNVQVFPSVPQLEVFPHADAVITHGGIGTVNESIFFGLPMVVYSGKKVEQNGNAARIAFHELGVCGDRDQVSPNEIVLQVEQVLTDPRYRANVQRMQQIYRAYDRAGKAVELIEAALRTSP